MPQQESVQEQIKWLQEKEHEHIIEELVAIALTKSIFSAIAVAKKLKNPHLLDDFHDALVDHYYDKLIQARKIS